jgi:DNA-binding beta-propeller fold protein YncE
LFFCRGGSHACGFAKRRVRPACIGRAAASAQSSLIYVTNSAGDSIHVIDFSPDAKRVYVSNEVDRTLDVIERKSGRTVTKVKLSGHPNNIATTKDGGRVIVGIAEEPGALDIIDTASLKLVKSIPVKGRLHNVYVTPDNKYAITGSIRNSMPTGPCRSSIRAR